MGKLKRHGRFIVAFIALTIAFALSVQFSDRGVQFDLRNSSVSAAEGADDSYDLAALKIFNRVLLRIKDNYVDPSRVDPNKMLIAALDQVQNSISELVVTFVGGKEKPTEIQIHVNGDTQSFEVQKIESLWEMSFRLQKMFRFIDEHLEPDAELDFSEIEYAAINGMLSTLDPHSILLSPKHYDDMRTQTGGKFGGLGIVISIRDGGLTVMSPIPGTPAAKKGIKARDKIVRIGDASTVNMGLQEAVGMMRGDPGEPIDIWVMRESWTEAKKFTIVRAIINIDSVDGQALGDKIGYIRIKNFQSNTHDDLVAELTKLKKKMGGMQGLVLDMRDNPGGLLDQAIKVSDTFLEEGAIVSTVGVGNRMRDQKVATRAGTEAHYPILVLVNAGSASASEIVAGAIQNNKRGLVVGDTTFGKGSVQVLYEFNDKSALKLTIAQYLTPGDVSIQGSGIRPDLRLTPVTFTDGNADMFLSHNILREGDLQSALSNAATSIVDGDNLHHIRFLADPAAEGEDADYQDPNEFREDFEIRFAQELLASAPKAWKAPELMKLVQPVLEKISAREMDRIHKELKTFGVDWSAGENPKDAEVALKLTTSAKNNRVKAGEKIDVTAELTNKSKSPLYRMKAIATSDNPVFDDREFIFGKLNPGESKSWSVEVEMPMEMPTRFDPLTMQVSGPQKSYGTTLSQAIRIVGQPHPQFAFGYEIDDTNGDGILQKGEEVTFRTSVKNVGTADSKEAMVFLKSLAGEAVYLKEGRATIENIKQGETKTADFTFQVKKAPKDNFIEIEVDIFDEVFRDFVHRKIKLPYSEDTEKVKKASGVATLKSGPANLYEGASTATDTAAIAQKGATLPVVAKKGEWIKVNVGEQKAWVEAKAVNYDAKASAKLSGISRHVLYQSPQVTIDLQTMQTSKKSVPLKAKIQDEALIKDYYIFVFNRENATKANTRKLNYTRVDAHEADISAEIPLFSGMNRISIVARDENGMQTTQDVYVYRE
ncbi:MXAN_5808 family serine peptidase [Bradymonas sediminis]|nr:MXAN_5808 family serine peptidase [Bradymonas sediminis]TDP62384.1 carboxyl-terminal processing protease [Bradymonas sediminis]